MKKLGSSNVEPELIILEVCKYMGWDYWTYLKQPDWFIDLIALKLKIDAEFQDIELNKLKSKNA